jgi:hypothetical protein
MSLPYVVRPLDPWIGPRTRFPQRSRFRSDWRTTLAELSYEIERLGASSWVLQIDVAEYDLRKDGGLRANAQPSSHAIRINFIAKAKGALSFAIDRYDDWRDNVRAVAKTLEALRVVDRYGVATAGEQYRGWTAIDSRPATMSREQAAEFIAHWAGAGQNETKSWAKLILGNPVELTHAYRLAAKIAHPDVTGDDGDTMARLNAARDLLQNGNLT